MCTVYSFGEFRRIYSTKNIMKIAFSSIDQQDGLYSNVNFRFIFKEVCFFSNGMAYFDGPCGNLCIRNVKEIEIDQEIDEDFFSMELTCEDNSKYFFFCVKDPK